MTVCVIKNPEWNANVKGAYLIINADTKGLVRDGFATREDAAEQITLWRQMGIGDPGYVRA